MSFKGRKYKGESELTVSVRFQMSASLFPLRALVADLDGERASPASLLETPGWSLTERSQAKSGVGKGESHTTTTERSAVSLEAGSRIT